MNRKTKIDAVFFVIGLISFGALLFVFTSHEISGEETWVALGFVFSILACLYIQIESFGKRKHVRACGECQAQIANDKMFEPYHPFVLFLIQLSCIPFGAVLGVITAAMLMFILFMLLGDGSSRTEQCPSRAKPEEPTEPKEKHT